MPMKKLLCRSCGFSHGTISTKLEKAIESFVCVRCGDRTILKFLDNDDGDSSDSLHMTTNQKLLEIMDRDLPHFIEWLGKKYTPSFLSEHAALLFLMMEGGESDRFFSRFNGTNRSLFRSAHAAIRLLAMEMNKATPELDRCRLVMNTIWQALEKDIGSQGIPDVIYEAFMRPSMSADGTTPQA